MVSWCHRGAIQAHQGAGHIIDIVGESLSGTFLSTGMPSGCLSIATRRKRPRKRHKPEEIVAKLRQVDVLVSQGQSVADAVRSIGVTEVTYYRGRQEFGGLKSDQVKRLKDLETENTRLRRAIADLTLDKLILQEAARGKFQAPRRRGDGAGTFGRGLGS